MSLKGARKTDSIALPLFFVWRARMWLVQKNEVAAMRWISALAGVLCTVVLAPCASGGSKVEQKKALPPSVPNCTIIGFPEDTLPDPQRKGTISIEGLVEEFEVDPKEVQTLRQDVFKKGYFSVFDVLAHTCRERGIGIRHHFDSELRTHVIDSIDGKEHWWYAAHYHGGGRCEEPVHRMDTFPYKDRMEIRVYQVSKERIEEIHSAFRAEARRLKANDNKVIVPEVAIRTPGLDLTFKNVEVKCHGLRSDMFQKDVLTGADIMLSLAERGEITLECQWLGTTGRSLVQGYSFTRFGC